MELRASRPVRLVRGKTVSYPLHRTVGGPYGEGGEHLCTCKESNSVLWLRKVCQKSPICVDSAVCQSGRQSGIFGTKCKFADD